MCIRELWSTPVYNPFYFFKSSSGIAGGKRYQKNTIAFFIVVRQMLLFYGVFACIMYYPIVSPSFFLIGLLNYGLYWE